MKGYVTNIERATLANQDYRRALFTGRNTQLVIMTLRPGEEIGAEKHARHALSDGVAVVVPAGVEHNIINTSKYAPMRLYTLYNPPEHPDNTVPRTKQDDHGH